ncbi:MAG: hypothetical protein AAF311_03090, partial [Pseudomonadota bacterium]
LLDAFASIEFGGPSDDQFKLIAFGRNLTDEVFRASHTNSVVDFATNSRPREYGVELLFDF